MTAKSAVKAGGSDPTAKQVARTALDALPDDATFDDVIEAFYVRWKVEQAERDVVAGKGIPQDEVEERARQWCE